MIGIFYLKEDMLTPTSVGVLGALWGTALIKGDIKSLWNYDEAEEEKEKGTEAHQDMNGHTNKTTDTQGTKNLSIFERDRKSELVFISVNLRSKDD